MENLAFAALGDTPNAERSSVCPVPDCAAQNMKQARTHGSVANDRRDMKRLRVELLADETVRLRGASPVGGGEVSDAW